MRVKLDNNQSILRIINNTDEMIHYTTTVVNGNSRHKVPWILQR